MHITNDLLEIRRGHRDDTGEFDRRNLNRPDIELNQIQRVIRHHLLLPIHDLNPELRGVRLPHEQNDAFIVAHRLYELEEVDHVHTEDMLLGAVELVKAVGLEPEMYQDRMGAIHRHDLETRAVEFNIGIGENVFNSLDKGPEGSGFNGADPEE